MTDETPLEVLFRDIIANAIDDDRARRTPESVVADVVRRITDALILRQNQHVGLAQDARDARVGTRHVAMAEAYEEMLSFLKEFN